MILSLRGAPIGVWLMDFHLFSLLKSIFKKISFWSISTASCLIQIDQKLIFLNIDLSKENKWKLINVTFHWSSWKLKIIKKQLDQSKKAFPWFLNKWPASRPVSQATWRWSTSKWAGLQPQHKSNISAFQKCFLLQPQHSQLCRNACYCSHNTLSFAEMLPTAAAAFSALQKCFPLQPQHSQLCRNASHCSHGTFS